MSKAMADLSGKVALVTGVGQNIGLATARALAASGAVLALNDLYEEVVNHVAAELPASARALAITADVRDPVAVQRMVDRVVETFGRVDILVNNAGASSFATILDMTVEEWDLELDVNLKGTFLVSQAVAKDMVAKGTRGRIICLASTAGSSARVGGASHCSSKAGVAMLARVMAMELGPRGITVNAVSPGLVPSARQSSSQGYRDAFRTMVPCGRLGQPEDIANAIVFLASDTAEWINGVDLNVDGGFLAGRALPPSL
jgi:3-oxoacyl-[acyl-carrier protein] reductase